LLSFLGLGGEGAKCEHEADTATVRKIVARLESLPEDQARYIASFAYILGRVAHADLDISAEEVVAMESLVMEHGSLPQEQAVLVVEIAKSQNRLFGGTENFLVTREFFRMADEAKRDELMHCLFAVSAADGSISADEEQQLRQISEELGMPPSAYLAIRGQYNDHRSVIQRLDKRGR
jgi:uncharacterized tellurite resistance protein B-like protein